MGGRANAGIPAALCARARVYIYILNICTKMEVVLDVNFRVTVDGRRGEELVSRYGQLVHTETLSHNGRDVQVFVHVKVCTFTFLYRFFHRQFAVRGNVFGDVVGTGIVAEAISYVAELFQLLTARESENIPPSTHNA